MNGRKSSASPVTSSSSTSASSSRTCTSTSVSTEGWDADDEGAMSNDEAPCSPRFNRSIPAVLPSTVGPYCPRRPTLREILANASPAPWTLTAFMAYLSNNHCLETLEFTMDAGRYKKHFAKMMSRPLADGLPAMKDREYVQALWQRLVEAYIKPDGSREVNLPSDVRDPILRHPPSELPPAPESLDAAVSKVYELMEDSVLVPFLNSAWPQAARSVVSQCASMPADDAISVASGYTHTTSGSRRERRVEYPRRPHDSYVYSRSISSRSDSRQSAPSAMGPSSSLSPVLGGKNRFSARLTTSTSSPTAPLYRNSIAENGSDVSLSGTAGERLPGMTDDSGSNNSPIYDDPSTPPTSPPVSDASSPKRDAGMWKKLGRLGGMKSGRKKSQAGLRDE